MVKIFAKVRQSEVYYHHSSVELAGSTTRRPVLSLTDPLNIMLDGGFGPLKKFWQVAPDVMALDVSCLEAMAPS